MKIAVLCEDHTHDQYILRPLLSALMAHLGKRTCLIQPITSPRIRGFESMLSQVGEVGKRYVKATAMLIVAFDLDCDDGSAGRQDKYGKVRNAVAKLGDDANSVAVIGARQELEVFALWGVKDQIKASWKEIRSECHPKDIYFGAATRKSDHISPGGGRERLINLSLASGWPALSAACPELNDLENQVRGILAAR